MRFDKTSGSTCPRIEDKEMTTKEGIVRRDGKKRWVTRGRPLPWSCCQFSRTVLREHVQDEAGICYPKSTSTDVVSQAPELPHSKSSRTHIVASNANLLENEVRKGVLLCDKTTVRRTQEKPHGSQGRREIDNV